MTRSPYLPLGGLLQFSPVKAVVTFIHLLMPQTCTDYMSGHGCWPHLLSAYSSCFLLTLHVMDLSKESVILKSVTEYCLLKGVRAFS